ncbi:MAG TPA: DNA methyltransferase [Solirubrobacteraceae bacterium]|nr:DNA methyltransferase [Solirubrobacteraceae bacterium]
MSTVPFFQDDTRSWGLVEGDAFELLANLPSDSVDAIVTDPPYGIGFHSESWDGADIRRVAGEQPSEGAAFSAWTRQWARECLRVLKPGGHLLAFGAPRKFHRLTTGIEDGGFEIRDLLLWLHAQGAPKSKKLPGGLSSQLKPAYEPVLLARKPLAATTPRNVETWGTGALNIEAARSGDYWPAPLALSHASGCTPHGCSDDCPATLIDAMRPGLRPSRLFFSAKASKAEREAGCDELPIRNDLLYSHPSPRLRRNVHPTIKPLGLMRWLVRLTVPNDGLVVDPFAGSATTGIAALLEGRRFLGIEREGSYVDIACARLTHWAGHSEDER